MSNTYFRFKQFTINQDKCAMKVSTDACIQGAWTPVGAEVKHVLDIGAGTGLLSLMLAQRHPGILVDAIELDENTAQQAKENISDSPWAKRINVITGDVCTYTFERKYDMVICNPPFFQNSLLGPDAVRNSVRHNTTLTFEALCNVLKEILTPNGYCSILLPVAESQAWETLIGCNGFTVFNRLLISPACSSKVNRIVTMCTLSANKISAPDNVLCIYDSGKVYTHEFRKLLQPFYLFL